MLDTDKYYEQQEVGLIWGEVARGRPHWEGDP